MQDLFIIKEEAITIAPNIDRVIPDELRFNIGMYDNKVAMEMTNILFPIMPE